MPMKDDKYLEQRFKTQGEIEREKRVAALKAKTKTEDTYKNNTAKRSSMLADPTVSEAEKEELRYSQAIDDAIVGMPNEDADKYGVRFTGADNKGSNALAIIKQYDDSLPSDKGSKYMTTIDRLLTKIAGDKFSYDAESDPRYTLAQDYAKKAMKDQMAESALLTGGYGNSFGAAAGQQVYTDYMDSAVNDMEDRAYSKWAAERDNNYNLLGIMRDMEREEYDRARQAEQDAASKAETSKAAAQDLVYSYIKMHGGIEGLTDEELRATGWSDAYISAIVEETAKESADENNAAGEETLTKNDALVEQYYSMGLTVPDDILANSHYAGQRALVDGYSSYYKNRLANEGTLENIEIQKAQRGLQDTGNDEAIAKNDALVDMYIAQGMMPPEELIANSSYAGHEALISRTIENNKIVDGNKVLSKEESKKEVKNSVRYFVADPENFGDNSLNSLASLFSNALQVESYTLGKDDIVDIIKDLETEGTLNGLVVRELLKGFGVDYD